MAVLFASLSFASWIAHADESSSLTCTRGNDKVLITGAGSARITVQFDSQTSYSIERTTLGDCKDRLGFDCYQDGQLMINIPKFDNQVWINLDTDDNDSNNRLGESYDCVR
ncbi:MAG: hypothetical protein ACXWPM_02070 [Bdellovibrionota bacterium]